MLSQLNLESKGHGHSKKANALGNKKHPKKNLSRGSLSNWCNTNADTDISKTIC